MHIFSIYLRLSFYIKVDSEFPDWDLREGLLEVTGESLGGQKGEPKGGAKKGSLKWEIPSFALFPTRKVLLT